MENESNTQGQHKRQYDWLKGYQFKKGQSGNPGGMKKGTKSMKVWAREYLESLPEEERIKFVDSLSPDIVWRMAEGNPQTTTDITTAGQPLDLTNPKVQKVVGNFEKELNATEDDKTGTSINQSLADSATD